MKKLILKSGLYRYINRTAEPQERELDLEHWLKRQLTRLGITFVDPCCPITSPPSQTIQEQIASLQEQLADLQQQVEDLQNL